MLLLLQLSLGAALGIASCMAATQPAGTHLVRPRDLALTPRSLPKQKRALSSSLGLSARNLMKNTVSFGFLPGWGEPMQSNNCTSINQGLPKPMSIVGVYVQINTSDPDISQLDYFVNDILKQPGDLPVINLALMPVQGFAAITDEIMGHIARKMQSLNDQGLTVWLRYAHEMNGDWYPYAGDPAGFIQSWNALSEVIHSTTNSTYMLWSPNSFFAGDYQLNNTLGGYSAYWPDPDTVDIVGLSFYTYGGHERLNIMPPSNMALDTLQFFDQHYGSALNKPMVLSETGASFTYMLDWTLATGNATESAIKFDWLWQIVSPDTIQAIPSIKAVTWFEVIKQENAGDGTAIKIEDFRLVLGKDYIRQSAVNFFEQTDALSSSANQAAITPGAGGDPSISTSDSSAGLILARPAVLLLLAGLGSLLF